METKQSHEDLRTLLTVLPPSIAESVEVAGNAEALLEIVMDLGRVPTARYIDSERVLRQREVSHVEIDQVPASPARCTASPASATGAARWLA